MKVKISHTQKKIACGRSRGDKDATINLISECSKLAEKEYKTRLTEWGRSSSENWNWNLF